MVEVAITVEHCLRCGVPAELHCRARSEEHPQTYVWSSPAGFADCDDSDFTEVEVIARADFGHGAPFAGARIERDRFRVYLGGDDGWIGDEDDLPHWLVDEINDRLWADYERRTARED